MANPPYMAKERSRNVPTAQNQKSPSQLKVSDPPLYRAIRAYERYSTVVNPKAVKHLITAASAAYGAYTGYQAYSDPMGDQEQKFEIYPQSILSAPTSFKKRRFQQRFDSGRPMAKRRVSYTRPAAAARRFSYVRARQTRFAKSRALRLKKSPVISKAYAAKILQAIAPVNVYNTNTTTQIVSTYNQCAYGVGAQMLSATDAAAMFTAVNASGAIVIGSAIASGTPEKLLIKSMRLTTDMTNMDTMSVNVTAYWCVARRDNLASVQTLINNGFSANNYSSGNVDPSLELYQSADFCDYFKILERKTFQIVPGGHVQLVKVVKPEAYIRSKWTTVALVNTFTSPKVSTHTWVFRIVGMPAGDSGAAAQPLISGGKVNLIQYEKYEYVCSVPLDPIYTHTNALVNKVGNVQNIDPVTDAVIVESVA